MMTQDEINKIVNDGLHQTFTELAEKLADAITNPELVAQIPFHTFAAENYMRTCWANYLAVQLETEMRHE